MRTRKIRRAQPAAPAGHAPRCVGEPEPVTEQLPLLVRTQLAVSEARPVERAPEAVAGVGKVVAGGGGDEPGVDADKQ